jgi:hypothetical protein
MPESRPPRRVPKPFITHDRLGQRLFWIVLGLVALWVVAWVGADIFAPR